MCKNLSEVTWVQGSGTQTDAGILAFSCDVPSLAEKLSEGSLPTLCYPFLPFGNQNRVRTKVLVGVQEDRGPLAFLAAVDSTRPRQLETPY